MGTLSSPTLSTIRSNVRNLLNQPNASNSFWSDAELDTYINEAIRIYAAELMKIDEGLFTAQVDRDIWANTETVALPSDFFAIRAVYKKVDTTYIMLPYRNNLTEGYDTDGGTNSNTYLPYYYFRGNSLVLRPVPVFNETAGLRVEYLQFPDTLVSGGDYLTAQISPLFSQVIEMYAVYKAKVKESLVNGVDTSVLAKANLAELHRQFMDMVQIRSKNPTAIIPFIPET